MEPLINQRPLLSFRSQRSGELWRRAQTLCTPLTGDIHRQVCLQKRLMAFLPVSHLSTRMKEESSSSDEDHRLSGQTSGFCQSDLPMSSGSICYKKTLRLTSQQLVCMLGLDFLQDDTFVILQKSEGGRVSQGLIFVCVIRKICS